MKEAYFDPALQKHKERQALIHKWQARRAFFKKHGRLIALSIIGFGSSIALVVWKIF